MSELTPMMKQYRDAKEAAKGALLLFRMGDFYEMFFDDAYKAAAALGITVTTRDRNKAADEQTPMAGFPHQHLDAYLARLVAAGHKVAVCEQMEDPKKAKSIVKREVTRIVTPGTLTDETMLDPRKSNYLAAVYIPERCRRNAKKDAAEAAAATAERSAAFLKAFEEERRKEGESGDSEKNDNCANGKNSGDEEKRYEISFYQDASRRDAPEVEPRRLVGLSWVDLSTGHFSATTVPFARLFDHLARIRPSETLIPEDYRAIIPNWFADQTTITTRPDWVFEKRTAIDALKKQFRTQTFEGFGFDEKDDIVALQAAGGVLDYLLETQKSSLEHIDSLVPFRQGTRLEIDEATRRSLEIVQTYRDGRSEGSLLAALNRCSTSMGSRLLAEWISSPLTECDLIGIRQDAVAELIERAEEMKPIRDAFRGVCDLERATAKVVQDRAAPRDLIAVGKTLRLLPLFKGFLDASESRLLKTLGNHIELQTELCDELERAFVEETPLNYRDGGFVRDGYSKKLDEFRRLQRGGKEWLAAYQASEVRRTGLTNLKVGFNSVFGYYLELSRSAADKIPENYVRKQTLKNVERYVTAELKEYEEKALGAEEMALDVEFDIFETLRKKVAEVRAAVQAAASVLAHFDVIDNLAVLAVERNYCRPQMVEEPILIIDEGRHPALDAVASGDEFVPNGAYCDKERGFFQLVTGPNMAGKSTYIRQNALLILMAQMGAFIPAREATIGVVDRIFARVGASDELARGQSTFMVEMIETARILNNATRRSFVVLDEIGRGTSTYDGVALAWALVEFIVKKIKCRTFFATHYHELTDLADMYDGIGNLNVAVREWRDEIAFLHKISPGAADKSYGVHVARLAGVPKDVVDRAQEILAGLEAARTSSSADALRKTLRQLTKGTKKGAAVEADCVQFSLFGPEDHPVVDALRRLDVDRLSPMDALTTLHRWKEELEASESSKRR